MKNNADPAMRNRPLIGVRVLLGLKPDGQTNGPPDLRSRKRHAGFRNYRASRTAIVGAGGLLAWGDDLPLPDLERLK